MASGLRAAGRNRDSKGESKRPRCGAKTRAGAPCLMRPVAGKRRCRLHGGLSTGPKTPEGRAQIAAAQRRRLAERVHGSADE
jgi:hypothetical protein